ncbi:protein of unknown function [Fulvimarina manganoxydans]|uniref:DUF4214 domain-containing protein n=1 Tax=Fulvimarina manganoxydans TaxID=937218 RepID=A0A1W2D4E2_9HYPH|nr:DUF4214 domain-containing protein [Fulvimarina manganoxydans]SMC92417.1 protein of unknown function [Fulvimarina manganoxydans]
MAFNNAQYPFLIEGPGALARNLGQIAANQTLSFDEYFDSRSSFTDRADAPYAGDPDGQDAASLGISSQSYYVETLGETTVKISLDPFEIGRLSGDDHSIILVNVEERAFGDANTANEPTLFRYILVLSEKGVSLTWPNDADDNSYAQDYPAAGWQTRFLPEADSFSFKLPATGTFAVDIQAERHDFDIGADLPRYGVNYDIEFSGSVLIQSGLLNAAARPASGEVNTAGISFETQPGTSGNDLKGELNNPTQFDGGAGFDTYVIGAPATSFTMEMQGTTVELSDGTFFHRLINVERVNFSNGFLRLDTDRGEIAGSAYRTYEAAFNRTPDNDGLKYWIEQMDSGLSLDQVAEGFTRSSEFTAVYGANVANRTYVQTLYQNVLDRAPEQAGIDFWTAILDRGDGTRASVLADFADSEENILGTSAATDQGIFIVYG